MKGTNQSTKKTKSIAAKVLKIKGIDTTATDERQGLAGGDLSECLTINMSNAGQLNSPISAAMSKQWKNDI